MGRTSYGPTGFDADGISGWNAIDTNDAFTENLWDFKWDFATGECVYNKG